MHEERETYVKVNGKWIPYKNIPCYTCKYRYDIHCPKCGWNANGRYDTYGGIFITKEEADKLNEELKNENHRQTY